MRKCDLCGERRLETFSPNTTVNTTQETKNPGDLRLKHTNATWSLSAVVVTLIVGNWLFKKAGVSRGWGGIFLLWKMCQDEVTRQLLILWFLGSIWMSQQSTPMLCISTSFSRILFRTCVGFVHLSGSRSWYKRNKRGEQEHRLKRRARRPSSQCELRVWSGQIPTETTLALQKSGCTHPEYWRCKEEPFRHLREPEINP